MEWELTMDGSTLLLLGSFVALLLLVGLACMCNGFEKQDGEE
jgi:hypothetical protein